MVGVLAIPAPTADAVAVNAHWVVYRVSTELYAAPAVPGATPRLLINGPVGRPALGGNVVVFELDGRIEAIDLTTDVRTDPAPAGPSRAARTRRSSTTSSAT